MKAKSLKVGREEKPFGEKVSLFPLQSIVTVVANSLLDKGERFSKGAEIAIIFRVRVDFFLAVAWIHIIFHGD